MGKTAGASVDGTSYVSGQGNKPLSHPAHAFSYQAVINETEANSENGLSDAEALRRVELYGRNGLTDGNGVQPFKVLIRQVANAMMLVSVSIHDY